MSAPINARAVATAIDARKSGPIPLTSGAALAPFNDCGGVDSDTHGARPEGPYAGGGALGSAKHGRPGTNNASRCNSGPQSPLSRDQARAAGLSSYFGVRCAYGHHRRYVANRMCVACSSAHAAARKRGLIRPPPPPKPPERIAQGIHVARREGLMKYHGRPHSCGETVRYTCSTKCVKCESARNRKRAPR